MVKLVLTFILGLASYPLLCDAVNTVYMYAHLHGIKISPSADAVMNKVTMIPGYGLGKSLTGQCTKDISKNGHGWVFVRRNFYQCDQIQVLISDLIYGEYTKPIDKELEKQVCKNCRM